MYIALARQPTIIVLTRRQTDILAHTLFGLFWQGDLAMLGDEIEAGWRVPARALDGSVLRRPDEGESRKVMENVHKRLGGVVGLGGVVYGRWELSCLILPMAREGGRVFYANPEDLNPTEGLDSRTWRLGIHNIGRSCLEQGGCSAAGWHMWST
jgi:hypothetical protein